MALRTGQLQMSATDFMGGGGGDRIVTLCNVQCLRQISLGEDCIVTLVHQTKYILLKQSASATQA